MLSYRHVYHVGNHADILKHYCLFETILYFIDRGKPFSYIDTHAGAGLYRLDSEQANKTREYAVGVLKITNATLEINSRLDLFREFLRPLIEINQYPGSAWIANTLIPDDGVLNLYELHPSDFPILQQNILSSNRNARTRLFHSDGLDGLLTLVPPKIRRAIIMLDPSYEVKTDYGRVVTTVQRAYQKFGMGCYLIWYPLLFRSNNDSFYGVLRQISSKYIRVELCVTKRRNKSLGMYGSGMWIINPPFRLHHYLQITLPQLVHLLKQDESATFSLEAGQL